MANKEKTKVQSGVIPKIIEEGNNQCISSSVTTSNINSTSDITAAKVTTTQVFSTEESKESATLKVSYTGNIIYLSLL